MVSDTNSMIKLNSFSLKYPSIFFVDEPYTNALMELQLPVVTNAVCEKAYEEFDVTITNKEICAGGDPRGGKDACGVIKLDIYYKLYGI